MNVTSIDSSRKFVKGRIAETIFVEMFRKARNFTVLPFGYEYLVPELAHLQHVIPSGNATMETIRHAPDFVVINTKKCEVSLIEVKYQMNPKSEHILKDAKKMSEYWKESYLFLATPEGFFMDKASAITDGDGVIKPLKFETISKKLQEDYCKLLNEFIKQQEREPISSAIKPA
ncbi:MAG: hypothetical protein V1745_00845 [Patescibacteria group bacterium]